VNIDPLIYATVCGRTYSFLFTLEVFAHLLIHTPRIKFEGVFRFSFSCLRRGPVHFIVLRCRTGSRASARMSKSRVPSRARCTGRGFRLCVVISSIGSGNASALLPLHVPQSPPRLLNQLLVCERFVRCHDRWSLAVFDRNQFDWRGTRVARRWLFVQTRGVPVTKEGREMRQSSRNKCERYLPIYITSVTPSRLALAAWGAGQRQR
jgi:hypothetical protein